MKHILKKLFIPPLTSRPVSALASHFLNAHTPVFLIHQLAHDKKHSYGLTPDHLRNCLSYLTENGHNFVSLKDAILALQYGHALPDKAVVFTIDDGFMEQTTAIVPIFLEFKCPLTFFVITDMLDQAIWPWDAKVSWLINNSTKSSIKIEFSDEAIHIDISNAEKKHYARDIVRAFIKETDAENITDALNCVAIATGVTIPDIPPHQYKAMTWDVARELEAKGVTFAPHSKTHQILSKMNAQSAKNEIEGSWQRLKEELNDPLNVFGYPTGRLFDFGSREISILKENNFLAAVSTIPGHLTSIEDPDLNLFSLPRLDLPESMTDFIQYCTWIEYAKNKLCLR